MQQKATNLSY